MVLLGDGDSPDTISDDDLIVIHDVPLIGRDGYRLGALVVMDRQPRALDDDQRRALDVLGDQVVTRIELEAAMRRLDESERRWRSILDVIPVGVFILDASGKPFYVNRKAEELLEKKLADVTPEELARTYSAYIAGTDQPYPTDRMAVVRALSGERTTIDDIEIHTPSGRRALEVTGAPGFDENGRVAYAIAAFHDITERRCLEQALARESRFVRLLQNVAMASNEAATLHDAIQAAIDHVCTLAGWPLGHCWIVSPDDPNLLISAAIWHNSTNADVSRFVRLTGRTQLRRGEGLPGRVLESAAPAWILDTQNDAQFIRSHHVQAPGLHAAFAFPVVAGHEVIAVLEFFAGDPRPPDADFMEVMRHVGQQLGRVTQRMRTEAALIESEQEYRDLIENSLDLICTHDLRGNLLMINRSAVESLGFDSADQLIGKNLADLIPPKIRPELDQYLTRIITEGRDEGFMTVLRRDGAKRIWEYRNSLRQTTGSQIVRGVARDVTDRLRAEQLLAESEARYRLLFERNLAGVCRTTFGGTILDVNEAFVRLFGYDSREEVLGVSARDLYPDAEGRAEYLRRLTASGQVMNLEIRLRRKDGSQFWALLSATLVAARGAEEPFIEATVLDITARKESEERNAYQATHDTLTGLPNRMLLEDRLDQAIAAADRTKTQLAVGFIDLDRFKPINDELGHAAGDFVLREVASRIRRALRQTDTVARLGGDEFVALLTAVAGRDEAERALAKVAAAIREPIDFAGRAISVEASIGIGLYPQDASDGESLIRFSDQAMYRAKMMR